MRMICREIWPSVQERFLHESDTYVETMWAHFLGWGMLMCSRMIGSEGKEWHDSRQGQFMHSSLDLVKHVGFYPLETHYVLTTLCTI